jgi:hypothetical protein
MAGPTSTKAGTSPQFNLRDWCNCIFSPSSRYQPPRPLFKRITWSFQNCHLRSTVCTLTLAAVFLPQDDYDIVRQFLRRQGRHGLRCDYFPNQSQLAPQFHVENSAHSVVILLHGLSELKKRWPRWCSCSLITRPTPIFFYMKQSKRLQRAVAAGLSKHSFRTAPEDTPFLQWIQPATEKLYTSALESM